mgnify:CR=1 FL=1
MNTSFERWSGSPRTDGLEVSKKKKPIKADEDSGIRHIPDDSRQAKLDRLNLELNDAYEKNSWDEVDRIQDEMVALMEDMKEKTPEESMGIFRERFLKLKRLENELRELLHDRDYFHDTRKDYSALEAALKQRIKRQLKFLGSEG